jgi:alkylation response protein AidB-like acyl-CoA dehydrogenase
MTDLDTWRAHARTWLEIMAPTYGSAARSGLDEDADLALARRYMAERHAAGFAGIAWPAEFGGQDLSPLHKMTFEMEEMQLGMPTHYFAISLGMPIPVVQRFCEDREFARDHSLRALRGEEIWCQLFSEPAAGSDLAGLRTRAEQQPDGSWRVNGQKLWTSYAHLSDYGVIVVRTDPAVPKHRGLTYFWIDMRAPGVEVRRIKLAAADSHVNEVFLDDVRLEDSQRLSSVGGGFGVAMATLMIERYTASDSGGFGPPLSLFASLARETRIGGRPAIEDGRVRQAIARNYAMRNGLEAITARAMTMMQQGMEPGPEGSLNKLVSVRSRQRLSELAIDLMGTAGFAWDQSASGRDDWVASWLSAPTGRIAGGADEMLLNTIAEKILGLPQDHRPDKGVPFNQIPA